MSADDQFARTGAQIAGFCEFCRMNRTSTFWSILILVALTGTGIPACQSQETPPSSSPNRREVVDKAEVMPRFPGCEDLAGADDMDKYRCSIQMLMDYLGRDLTYPPEAKAKGTSGEAVVQFIVKEDGQVEFVEIVRNPGDGLGEEAARLVRQMAEKNIRWRPGYKDGKPVAVRFNLPVAFQLPLDPDTGKIPED